MATPDLLPVWIVRVGCHDHGETTVLVATQHEDVAQSAALRAMHDRGWETAFVTDCSRTLPAGHDLAGVTVHIAESGVTFQIAG